MYCTTLKFTKFFSKILNNKILKNKNATCTNIKNCADLLHMLYI